jgi:predicted NAD-dependent protein-ADP-ribosyltransferase YbiA (DUF1768 family)
MKTVVKGDILILVPDSTSEAAALAHWQHGREGQVLALESNSRHGVTIRFLGPRAEVCREPIPVSNRHPNPCVRLIGNLAPTAFELDGTAYASIESFWQSLKFPEGSDRARLAALDGPTARTTGAGVGYGTHVRYQGSEVPTGGWEHWQLLERACRAKFTQHAAAREALVATACRPLTYRVRAESRLLPGAVVADIWMRIRAELAPKGPPSVTDEEEE